MPAPNPNRPSPNPSQSPICRPRPRNWKRPRATPARDDDLDDEETEDLRRSYLLGRFWHTALRFWTTPGYRVAWLLSAALLVIVLLNIAAAYGMNFWNRAIFDALEKKDAGTLSASLADLLRDPGSERLLHASRRSMRA